MRGGGKVVGLMGRENVAINFRFNKLCLGWLCAKFLELRAYNFVAHDIASVHGPQALITESAHAYDN
jgi:hypothetical protein